MKRWISLLAALLLLSAEALAEPYNLGDFRLIVLDDPYRISFEKGQRELSQASIEKAIISAAPVAGWRLTRTEGGLELQNLVRSKHLIVLEATYDATGYALRYVRSDNLLYREQVRNG